MLNTNANYINVEQILSKIQELLNKGESIKMKNKDKFKLTLIDTRVCN